MEKRKVLGTFCLVCCLPILFAIPGITQYPMTAAAGVAGMVAFINIPSGEPTTEKQFKKLEACEVIFYDAEEINRQRAKPCSA